MDKIKYFESQIIEICKNTRTMRPVLAKDNRLGNNYVAEVYSCIHTKSGRRKYFMRYNKKIIDKMPLPDIYHAICHELGHIRTSGNHRKEREYKAEKFALKVIKKYRPRYYKRAIAYVKSAQYFRDNIYAQAYAKLIKEIK